MLSIRGLSLAIRTSRHGTRRLDDWSCELAPGSLHVLVGPSGIGKTSLALALIGAPRANVTVDGGEVRLDGVDLLAMSRRQRRRLWGTDIVYVPQSSATALVPMLDVVGQLLNGRSDTPAAEERDRLRGAFQMLDVPGFDEDRLPHHYSGGQLQRALLARLFIARPRLIVLDEPTTALHPELKASVMEAVKQRVLELGAVCLVVSHEHARFATACDGLIDVGGMLQTGLAQSPTPEPEQLAVSARPAPARTEAPLTVRDLSVRTRDGRGILNGISFEVPSAGCLGIIGRSGAGKTTLLRAILGLHGHATGDVRVAGNLLPLDYRRRSLRQRRLVEYVPQSVKQHLNQVLTTGFLLTRRLTVAGQSATESDVTARLREVGLAADEAAKTPAELSGGECQRLGIALALAADPAVILLDEITASLDAETNSVICDVLAAARSTRMIGFVLVSHQPRLISTLADAVVVIEAGRVTERTPPRLPDWFVEEEQERMVRA